ncbi:MAG: TlyA family RNA methyltransferase [Rhizobiaceae bacterium]|nr:TlyA family RNA methyltransferase [Rhizobiaceae bacterium]
MRRPPTTDRLRLDELLVSRGFFEIRSRARDAIARGTVSVGGETIAKPGKTVPTDAEVTVDDPAQRYVSRAALKLVHALDHFGFDPANRIALDVGASTGGFTQVMLERGAAHVIAIDVGHGQMRPGLASDPRVRNIEGLNARDLRQEDLAGRTPAFVVSDVSFISLRLALPPALALASPGAFGVFLVKPQFEAGRGQIGKGGIVDPTLGGEIATDMAGWLGEQPGWRAAGVTASPIEGGDGNREFLLGGVKDR